MKKVLALAVCVLAFPALSSAQQVGRVSGMAGATFQSQTDGVFGGEFGVNVHPNIEVYGGANLMRNILPRSIQRDLDNLSDALTFVTGDVWDFNAKYRAFTGVGGAKFLIPTGSNFRPYALAGAGFANVKVKITEVDFGDVTDDVLADLGEESDNVTKMFLEFGGGVDIPVGPLFMDIGYRFGRVLAEDGLNVSRVYYGFGARF